VFADGVAHQLEHQDCLADPCAAKEADLASLRIRRQEVDRLDAGYKGRGDDALVAQVG
jgi:hypothetical protein